MSERTVRIPAGLASGCGSTPQGSVSAQWAPWHIPLYRYHSPQRDLVCQHPSAHPLAQAPLHPPEDRKGAEMAGHQPSLKMLVFGWGTLLTTCSEAQAVSQVLPRNQVLPDSCPVGEGRHCTRGASPLTKQPDFVRNYQGNSSVKQRSCFTMSSRVNTLRGSLA